MARKKAGKENVRIVLDEDEEDEESGIKEGDVERYEVKIGPPMVSGRKSNTVRTPDGTTANAGDTASRGSAQVQSRAGMNMPPASQTSTLQIHKIEDDLRRTRDVVEDLRHTVGVLQTDFKNVRSEMDRISYLLRNLEGLKNTMKDIESTVSELSGLYDMISANVNPFIDVKPMNPSNGNVAPAGEKDREKTGVFNELSQIFDEEETPELEDTEEFGDNDLRTAEWILKWAQFLIDKVSKEGLEKTLHYYQKLGWIDDNDAERVIDVARGTAGPRRKDEGKRKSWKLGADDHVKSLEYIRRIKGI